MRITNLSTFCYVRPSFVQHNPTHQPHIICIQLSKLWQSLSSQCSQDNGIWYGERHFISNVYFQMLEVTMWWWIDILRPHLVALVHMNSTLMANMHWNTMSHLYESKYYKLFPKLCHHLHHQCCCCHHSHHYTAYYANLKTKTRSKHDSN